MELSLPHHSVLSFFQLAFFSCCFRSLISPDKIPRGQAAVWSLFLAYLPGHLVGETEQLGGPSFPARSSGAFVC